MHGRPHHLFVGVATALCVLASGCTTPSLPPRPSPVPSSRGASTSASPTGAGPVSPSTSAASISSTTNSPEGALPKLADLEAPDENPASETEQLEQALNAHSTPTMQQAIDVFSVSMATLPGASASDLPAGSGFSATVAKALLSSYYTQLTPDQQRVVDGFAGTVIATTAPGSHVLTAPGRRSGQAPSSTTTSPPGLRRTAVAAMSAQDPAADAMALLQQTINDWFAYRADLIGRVGGFELAVSTVQPKDNRDMDSQPSPNDPNKCRITIYPQYTKGKYTDNTAKFVFAHELFHCIQFTWSTLAGDPEWLVEGSAEFAAYDLYRSTLQPVASQSWQTWFTDPGRPLGQEPAGQGYGDWALFEAYRDEYPDPYGAIKAMIQTGGSTAGIVSAGHLDGQIFETLGTSTSLRSTDYVDSVFQLNWPGVQPDYGKRDTALDLGSRGVGQFSVVGKANFVHQQYTVGFEQDVGIVGVAPSGGGLLTHADSGAATVGEGKQQWFCVRSGGCTCPNGTGKIAELPPLTPPMLFSFAASAKATTANVTALPWDPDKYCRAKPTSDDHAVASSDGDPHLTTYNGLTYDLMTYGEFIATQDSTGGFTVQERHQQAGFGTAISAVALGDGSHRITFTSASIVPDAAVVVRGDGQPITASTDTVGGLTLTGDPQAEQPEWTVTWPDRSEVDITWADGFFVTVMAAPTRSAHLAGLLGTPASTFLGDLTLPDGQRADPMDNGRSFADAYRVTSSTTLFDYNPGQGVGSFDRPPANTTPVSSPTPQTLDSCQSSLGPSATTAEINSCAYDVTSLGNATVLEKAYTTLAQQGAAQILSSPDQTPPSSATVAAAGPDTASLTLTGTLDPNDETPITGTMPLTAGTVVVFKAACPSDPDTDVVAGVTNLQTNRTGLTAVCGPRWGAVPGLDAAGSVHPGESYIFIYESGTYGISAQADNHDPANPGTAGPFTLQVESTPMPTVITPQALAVGMSQTVAMRASGDTIALEAAPGSSGGTWTFTGNDQLCTQTYAIDALSNGANDDAADLGPICERRSQIELPPSTNDAEILVFDRDGSDSTVTVTHTR